MIVVLSRRPREPAILQDRFCENRSASCTGLTARTHYVLSFFRCVIALRSTQILIFCHYRSENLRMLEANQMEEPHGENGVAGALDNSVWQTEQDRHEWTR